ncbi:MAG: hypothetical protein CVV30_06805 [Methanomicrobiales archaeon HGW-Methanomicrobiales-1]|jgi:hypothetical protein|nr:MAG: hypothetical protein CVV30_06805 [Methanomicrobiales archaeon HGW-Methanomicrobiales-1]
MKKYSGIPELLDQFMEENGTDERWVTVQEIRQRFDLNRYQYNTISGFLRRLEFGSFGQCPFIVLRIEKAERINPSDPPKCRYLVKRKNMSSAKIPGILQHSGMQVRRKADSS